MKINLDKTYDIVEFLNDCVFKHTFNWKKSNKSRWLCVEELIYQDPERAYDYYSIIGAPRSTTSDAVLKECMMAVLQSSYWAVKFSDAYAHHGHTHDAITQAILASDSPYAVYQYTSSVLKKRWPEAEPIILKDPKTTLNYIMNFIVGYWKEGVEALQGDSYCRDSYKRLARDQPLRYGIPNEN